MIRTLTCVSIVLLVLADAAWSEEATRTELDDWIPSFGLSIGVIKQGAEGVQINTLRPPDDLVPPPGPFPFVQFTGDDFLLDPYAAFSSEVMTPGIDSIPGMFEIPGHPRLFVHGEIGGVIASTVSVAKESAPGKFTLPPPPPANECPGPGGAVPSRCPPANAVGGQGTETEVQMEALVGAVGIGIAFTADVFDRRFRLKPSFEYLQNGVQATGRLKHVVGFLPSQPPDNLPDYTFLDIQIAEERTLHHIGAGLELEMDSVRLGPFMLAVFANGQFYHLLDDRNIDQRSDFTFNNAPQVAIWNVKLDSTSYRAGVGMRFRFFPIED